MDNKTKIDDFVYELLLELPRKYELRKIYSDNGVNAVEIWRRTNGFGRLYVISDEDMLEKNKYNRIKEILKHVEN